MKTSLLAVLLGIQTGIIGAGEVEVNISGPSATRDFSAALKDATPGDTIRLLPAGNPVRMGLTIRNIKGLPGKPIIIDGSFNTLLGSQPVSLTDWKEVNPGTGLYHRQLEVVPIDARFFMIFNNHMERMGRQVKGMKADLKVPEELKNFEWTLTGKNDAWFKLPDGVLPVEAGVEEPCYDNGVGLCGECANLVIRNMIVKRFWNDGCNIHNNCRDILFENIAAIENGDDGSSAHETCKIKMKNFLSLRNGTGFCHVQNAECEHENVYIAEAFGRDILLENTFNTLSNVTVEGHANSDLLFCSKVGSVMLENCFFNGLIQGRKCDFVKGLEVKASNVMISGYAAGHLPSGVTQTEFKAFQPQYDAIKKQVIAVFAGHLPPNP